MKIRLLAIALAGTALTVTGFLPAVAEARGRYHQGPPAHAPAHGYRAQHGDYAWAQVIRVDPLISWEQRPVRRHECWDEPVQAHYERYPRRRGSDAGVVAGAIIGGVVGNQFGGGRGRVATTAAGAALGGAIARDMQHSNDRGGYYADSRTVYEERCRSVTEHVSHERVDGYEVTYRYGGRTYQTITDHHPGDRIQVRVDVAPVY